MRRYCAALLFCVLAVAPAWTQNGSLHDAQQLIKKFEFAAALKILRQLDSAEFANGEIRFFRGLAALALSEKTDDDEHRERLLDEAVAALHDVLIHFPDFNRVRVELAYALFLQNKDALAKENFTRVLAGKPPPPVAARVRQFLHKIRTRKKWSGYFSINMEQNNNFNGGINADTIEIFGLPFRVNEESRPQTQTGISFSGGGEYQYPINDKTRWVAGLDAARSEYRGHALDQNYAALRTGPRIFLSRRAEISWQTFAGQRWAGKKRHSRDFGLRTNIRWAAHRRLTAHARTRWQKIRYRQNSANNEIERDYFIGGDYLLTPLIQINTGAGWSDERRQNSGRTLRRRGRIGVNMIFPNGWTGGGNAEWSRARYEQNAPFSNVRRADHRRVFRVFVLNRGLTVFGFSPQLSLARELQKSNSVFNNYQRTRADLRFVRQF